MLTALATVRALTRVTSDLCHFLTSFFILSVNIYWKDFFHEQWPVGTKAASWELKTCWTTNVKSIKFPWFLAFYALCFPSDLVSILDFVLQS